MFQHNIIITRIDPTTGINIVDYIDGEKGQTSCQSQMGKFNEQWKGAQK